MSKGFWGISKPIALVSLTLMACMPVWGQTYIYEDFEDDKAENWKTISGNWKIEDGECVVTGETAQIAVIKIWRQNKY